MFIIVTVVIILIGLIGLIMFNNVEKYKMDGAGPATKIKTDTTFTKIYNTYNRDLNEITAYNLLSQHGITPKLLVNNPEKLSLTFKLEGRSLHNLYSNGAITSIPNINEQISYINNVLTMYGIEHDDLHWGNILIYNGKIKLIDFENIGINSVRTVPLEVDLKLKTKLPYKDPGKSFDDWLKNFIPPPKEEQRDLVIH